MFEPLTEEQQACDHDNFEAFVGVGRLTNGDSLKIHSYTAEIKINCGKCKAPFRFIGTEQGGSPFRPMTSPDDCELRVPIAPGRGEIKQRQVYEMPPRDEPSKETEDEKNV